MSAMGRNTIDLIRRAALPALAHRARLLDPKGVDPDLSDEMVRSELGYVRPDEVIIPIKE